MRNRVLSAVVFLPIIFLVFFVFPPVVLGLFVAAMSVVGVYEILRATGFVDSGRPALYSLALSAYFPLWMYFSGEWTHLILGLFVYVILMFAEWMTHRKQLSYEKISGAFFAAVVIPLLFSAFVRIILREGDDGRIYLLLPFVIAFASDAGGLWFGKFFGRHKLAPTVSPKKSVEGSIGGIIIAVVASLVYGAVLKNGMDLNVSFGILVFYGIIGSVVSQFGDLAFSLIKREYGVKDYGTMIPGHGGLLDRFDSVAFCTPLVELLLFYIPFVTLL